MKYLDKDNSDSKRYRQKKEEKKKEEEERGGRGVVSSWSVALNSLEGGGGLNGGTIEKHEKSLLWIRGFEASALKDASLTDNS